MANIKLQNHLEWLKLHYEYSLKLNIYGLQKYCNKEQLQLKKKELELVKKYG